MTINTYMPRPNDDFLNKFWSRDAVERRFLPSSKDIKKKYNDLKDTNYLDESFKKSFNKILNKSPKSQNKNSFANIENWKPVLTPTGIFYYNEQTNEWMNNYGFIKENTESVFNPLINPFDLYSFDSGDSNKKLPIPDYNSSLQLLRFVDSDIYGFLVEKNQDPLSIDDVYPEYPFTSDRGLTKFGNLYEFVDVMNNIQTWDTGLAGRAFLGGALGNRLDIAGATAYGDPGSTANIWSQNWARLNKTAGLNSFYDVGDAAKRGVNSDKIYPSSLHKYQWFDFRNNVVKGSLNISIAAGYGGAVQIDQTSRKLNAPRAGYTVVPGIASPIYDLLISRPTATELESQNPYLVETNANGIKIAKIRELFSNDLNGDGSAIVSSENTVQFVSIDASVDQTLVTLDDKGSIRILYNYDISAEGFISAIADHWTWLAYFDKEWIANGFLTDETGEPAFIENKDFVSVTVSGGLGTFIYVWCLHKSGKLYGVEITTAAEQVAGPRPNPANKPKEKFIVPGNASSGRNPEFGKAEFNAGDPYSSGLRPDEYQIYFNYSNGIPISSVNNGVCKEIAYVLNFIPKINNYRFPVISVWGGYHTGGVLVCIDPTYIGYLPSISETNYPAQMCEIVKLQKIRTFTEKTERLLSKIQRYKAIYNSGTQTWSYINNPDLDIDIYNNIFGITENINGTNQIIYVPPRCVSIQRHAKGGASSSTVSPADGIINILSNNGTFSIISGNDIYVPCYFDPNVNPDYLQEINTYGKLTMKGDFSAPGTSWDYSRFGESCLFNYSTTSASAVTRYKYGRGNCYTSPTVVLPPILLENFNQEDHWKTFWDQADTSAGWGNPPNGVSGYYNITPEGSNVENILGFSYFDYLGNTNIEGRPLYAMKEQNYINNNHIQKVVCYGDTAGNLPIFTNQTINNNFDFRGNMISVLKIADDDVLENPFAWIRGVGDITYGIRFDGTIDLISHRTADLDGFLFDPFWSGVYPNDRRNPSGITFDNLKPSNYTTKINSLKKLGSYVQDSYTYNNYYLPSIYG